tara:strand:- start:265 stop:888 length:624 start_codon:yes stop_codon:yes gene_type:complete
MNVAFIPARSGSKGLPNKNIKIFNGLPLLAWSIKSAKKAHLIDEVVVSTDSLEIEDIAKEYGASTLKRTEALSNDTAKTIDVLNFHSEYLSKFKKIVILQPTSPYRPDYLIDECIKCMDDETFSNLATGFMCKNIEYGSHNNMRRQDFDGFFYDDGSIYITRNSLIKSSLWVGKKPYRFINKKQFTYEIDDMIDFKILETLIKQNDI